MSLANLIKNMHNSTRSPSLGAAIEQFYMKRAHTYDPVRHADKVTRFHPSQITYWGVCQRAYYLLMKREELGFDLDKPEPFETSLLRIFDHGHSVHSLYQDKILGPAGVLYGKWSKDGEVIEGFQPEPDWVYVEPRMWWPEKRISGYCDGYLKLDGRWFVLEIKSSNDQGFRHLKRTKEPRPYHARQAQIYMLAPHDLELKFEVEGAIILYVNKDNGQELDLFIPNNPEIVAPIMEGIDSAISALDQSMIPDRVSDCKTSKSKRAKDCIACRSCFSIG